MPPIHRFWLGAGCLVLAACTGPGPLGLGTKPSGNVQVFEPNNQSQLLVTTSASPMPISGGTTFYVFEKGYDQSFNISVVAWTAHVAHPCLVGSAPDSNHVLVSLSAVYCLNGDLETVNFVDRFGQHGPSQYFRITSKGS